MPVVFPVSQSRAYTCACTHTHIPTRTQFSVLKPKKQLKVANLDDAGEMYYSKEVRAWTRTWMHQQRVTA